MLQNASDQKQKRISRLYLMASLVLIIDQVSKAFALRFLPEFGTQPVIENIFHLTLVSNRGIAFGLFRHSDVLLFWTITASLAGLMIFSLFSSQMALSGRWALALILGGAAGNWVDRFRFGAVTDFLDFRIWPVFNLADSAIFIGVCIFMLQFFTERRAS